jgi:nucleotidyltransferase/DNA polymerase involved in DNA repair
MGMHPIAMDSQCTAILRELYDSLMTRLKRHNENRPIKNQCIKIKLSDFKIVTLERASKFLDFLLYENLLLELINRSYGKIRLMGIGVHFAK